jgi:hypothetical protein
LALHANFSLPNILVIPNDLFFLMFQLISRSGHSGFLVVPIISAVFSGHLQVNPTKDPKHYWLLKTYAIISCNRASAASISCKHQLQASAASISCSHQLQPLGVTISYNHQPPAAEHHRQP